MKIVFYDLFPEEVGGYHCRYLTSYLEFLCATSDSWFTLEIQRNILRRFHQRSKRC